MFPIQKLSPPSDYLQLNIIKKTKSELEKFYSQSERLRRQNKPPNIPFPLSVLQLIRNHLLAEFKGKCAYCESNITITNQGDFDHFRPRSSAKGLAGEFALDHYWPLVFDWRNLYLSCETCNRYKVNWFPVEGKRAVISLPFEKIIKSEHNLLIDPCNEDPSLHLGYKENGTIFGLSRKGEVTIEILKLNRKELVQARAKKLLALNAALSIISGRKVKKENMSWPKLINSRKFITHTERIVGDTKSHDFLGIERYFMEKAIRENPDLQIRSNNIDLGSTIKRYLSLLGIKISNVKSKQNAPLSSSKKGEQKSLLHRFSIESIVVENFKSIENLKVTFPKSTDGKEPWLMLLGENGVGKSSLLQALTLTLMGETYHKYIEIKGTDILRNGTDKGSVKIHQADQPPIELHFTKSKITSNIKSSPTYLMAYGSTRLFPSKSIKPDTTKGKVRAKNMFNPSIALYADRWLVSLYKKNKVQFDFAASALKSMLAKELNDPKIQFIVAGNEVYLHYSKKSKKPDTLKSLSDGYKSIIALACDIMQVLMHGHSTMEVTEGIVLIDEIGTHLHPKWKMRIVNSFRAAFPKLQFIVTTHDPLCLKGLYAGEIAVINKNTKGQVYALTNLPDPGEYRADQLLASRFFGLSSTIDEDLEKDFDEYYRLLSKRGTIKESEKTKLNKLKIKLRNKNHLGSSLREELVYNTVDTLLSQERLAENPSSIPALKNETIKIVQNLWNKPVKEQAKSIKV